MVFVSTDKKHKTYAVQHFMTAMYDIFKTKACLICTGLLILMAPALISRIDLRLNLHVSSKSKSTNPLATRPVRQAMEKAPGMVFVL